MSDKKRISQNLKQKLVVAISSRALFDLRESDKIYATDGVERYAEYQCAHENEVLKPGTAFPLVQKLLRLNEFGQFVEIILLSRNSADTGLRVFNSIEHYNLEITRAAFTSGQSPYRYVKAFGAHLFLSVDERDVRQALSANCAAASLIERATHPTAEQPIRIAFDGDAVVFSDEAERVFQADGLDAFRASEKSAAAIPLHDGPFKGFLSAIQNLQNIFPDNCPIHTALITARNAPAHERVIRTLRSWNIRIDEAIFLGGLNKENFLTAFGADIFFDDHRENCKTNDTNVTTAHVPHGVVNEID